MYEKVVHGGTIVTSSGTFTGSVAIEDGTIAELSEHELRGREVVDARDRIVFPGAVDLHAHFNEPGRTHWEGWGFGSRAAAAGGVTTVIEMPLNAVPATTTLSALDAKVKSASAGSIVDFALWGGFVDNNLDELAELAVSGIIGFKAFMIDTSDASFQFVDGELLREGMQRIAGTGLFLGVHAEDNERAAELRDELLNAGRRDPRAWLESRPPEVELRAIETALQHAAETECPLHVVHVSLPEGIDLLNRKRKAGQQVTFETCIHYLTLTDQDFIDGGTEYKCAPPLRDRARQEGLWEQLAAGEIDCVTSDHSPCPTPDKLRGEEDIWKAWGGITGIETLLPLLVSEGIARRGLSWELVARLVAQRPAELAGIADRKGSIRVGGDADLVLIAPEERWEVHRDGLHSRNKHSPFIGQVITGRVERVMLRGMDIVRDTEPLKEVSGRWVRRAGGPNAEQSEGNRPQTE